MRKISLIKGIKEIIKLFTVNNRKEMFGSFDISSVISEPYSVSNASNIFIADHVNIGAGSILYATNAPITIKKYFVSARGLKIATGAHERRVGRFLASIKENEKNHSIGLDKPVIINEDVWAGFDVTIIAGVEIGRGCTLAAGSVVTKNTPPYSICGGVPARFIKFYWTIDEIMKHEQILYPEEARMTKQQLDNLFSLYNHNHPICE